MNRPLETPVWNASALKLKLYCQGLRLHESAEAVLNQGREILRTRAGLGSGLELVLPGNLWVNAPVVEPFCEQSPLLLKAESSTVPRFWIEDQQWKKSMAVTLAPRPTWYGKRCSTGKPMVKVGTLQGTYLGIYPTEVCQFWTNDTKENCKFCSVGLNMGKGDAPEKKLQEVLEVVRAAREESNITYVDFNTGHYEDESYLDKLEPMIEAIKRETGLLIGIQTPPHQDLKRYDRLKALGVNRVSFCFELIDPEAFQTTCPGKNRYYGLDRYLQAMDYCASLGKTIDLNNPWVTNGEIIVGLESMEKSMEAIDRIVSVGAIPTVCVFRPLKGTDYEDRLPPTFEEALGVFQHFYHACMSQKLPIGVAPHIKVSLVMLPEECAGLTAKGRGWGYFWQKMNLGLKQRVYRRVYRSQLKGKGATEASLDWSAPEIR